MNFRQRLKKSSRPTSFCLDVGSVQKIKKGYKIQVFMSLHCFFARTSDVFKIKKHPLGHGAEIILKSKDYDFI